MNHLPLLLVSLLAVPTLASAAPAPVKPAPPSVPADLLLSVRAHAAVLFNQRIVSPGVSIRTPQVAPPSLVASPMTPGVVLAQGSVSAPR